jgi:hypothetical protein
MQMIVVGADTHKDTHTAVAVDGATGQVLAELTVPARKAGFLAHRDWARELGSGSEDLVWAIEDCRHVSGGLERFLVDSGERVVRIPPKAEGKSRMEALRCLKRQLARRVWQAFRDDAQTPRPSLTDLPKLRPVGELALT